MCPAIALIAGRRIGTKLQLSSTGGERSAWRDARIRLVLPDDVEVRVHDSTADIRYLVLPVRPKGTEGLSEIELAKLVTRDSMIGVMDALPALSLS